MHEELDRRAERFETPCGEGVVVWRAWGEGPVLVLLHGGSGSWRHWVRNIGFFARSRRVIAPDLPGLGESAMPPGDPTPAAVARALHAGIVQLLGPARHYDLAGFSFGSNCGAHLAALEGRHIRTLTLIGAAALGLPRPPLELVKVRDKEGEARIAAHRENLARLMFYNPALIDEEALAIQEWNTRHARLRSRGFATTTSLRDRLPELQGALRAIWGGRDAVAWPQIPERLALLRAIRPELRSEVIENAGHWVMYEAPEAFNAALERMLD
ncbi:MAG: alpha/beta fold hydrolase [Rhodovarius sp.]|nr:alpha/beta fold hydrolase [Rhodovarius sp.]MCX7932128.1 alpha/beta fold hydrolase [Rhodovarius sp.]MDW8315417.1 alpha/beta fold hydrolase [Rhodovarius sp.]